MHMRKDGVLLIGHVGNTPTEGEQEGGRSDSAMARFQSIYLLHHYALARGIQDVRAARLGGNIHTLCSRPALDKCMATCSQICNMYRDFGGCLGIECVLLCCGVGK